MELLLVPSVYSKEVVFREVKTQCSQAPALVCEHSMGLLSPCTPFSSLFPSLVCKNSNHNNFLSLLSAVKLLSLMWLSL